MMDDTGEGFENSLPLGISSKWSDAWMSKFLATKSEPTRNYIYDILI